MKPSANEYQTPDLYLASYLQVAGLQMVRTIREGNRVYFVFDTTIGNIEELKAAWFNGSGKVSAQAYSFSIKNLKSLVHSV